MSRPSGQWFDKLFDDSIRPFYCHLSVLMSCGGVCLDAVPPTSSLTHSLTTSFIFWPVFRYSWANFIGVDLREILCWPQFAVQSILIFFKISKKLTSEELDDRILTKLSPSSGTRPFMISITKQLVISEVYWEKVPVLGVHSGTLNKGLESIVLFVSRAFEYMRKYQYNGQRQITGKRVN